ncbi:MAG: hypothetical protein E7L01_05055 [Paenibacillus macerans]|uniref:hypothetical protein n=1 Tax=Paenibacillus TaxID=44249 RepID=UPI000ECCD45F|nr:hypothetical protein [Paenibacillus macerans]MBS5909208.1 hypothetical protein [Paenibacillus macerans]MDU7472719.1 hypothetical protein [Paenibacillus macerans]MEC0139089.1 hypothetical protein [Paenibacillus macerans]UMV47802.1 hypothetical protein LMZ02_31145 [Paenibacillus macerans]GBK64742.1 hypothetical protein PbDSM24746_47460 [Paenibacillus macerans]
MENNWFIISDFPFNPDFHYEIFQLLLNNDSKILLRKDNVEFEDMDEDVQAEIVEENFKQYVDGVLHFNSKKVKDDLDNEIKKLLIKSDDILLGSGIYHELFNSTVDEETLCKIKLLITEKINQSHELGTFFRKEALRFRDIEDKSFRIIEDRKKNFDWYEISQGELHHALVSEGLYNIIITNDIENFNDFKYYLNFIEDEEFILAIKDNIGDFEQEIVPKINRVFSNRFEIQTSI